MIERQALEIGVAERKERAMVRENKGEKDQRESERRGKTRKRKTRKRVKREERKRQGKKGRNNCMRARWRER